MLPNEAERPARYEASHTTHAPLGVRAHALFPGPGDMRTRCRTFDWSSTPLGHPIAWSASLRTTAETVLATAFPAIVLWGPELIQLYNDAYVPFLGVKHPRGLGQPTRECWPEVWDFNAPIYARVRAGETVFLENACFPLQRQGAGGPFEDLYITLSYSPVRDEAGAVGGVFIVLSETTDQVRVWAAQTAREQLEVRLRGALLETALVLDQISDGHFVLDAAFRIVSLNRHAERALGRPRRALVGQSYRDVFPALVGTKVERECRHVAAERAETHVVHHYIGDGVDVHLEIDAYPSGDGGIAVFWRDVSERVHAEAERARLLSAAEHASRAKSDFLTMMSHELRTPLNAIGGYAELIEMGLHGPVTPDQRVALDRIQRSQRHLLGLINGVLNFVKVDAGAVYYHLTSVPVDEVLATSEALIAPQVRAKGLTLTYGDCLASLRAWADGDKLQQVVLNLLSNAVKFTDPGGTITLSCALVDAPVDATGDAPTPGGSAGVRQVQVQVRDTGRGIDSDQHERIFQPFVQLDARLTRTHEGTGLGLAISRDLARGMGGDLMVESAVGAGSTFTLTLPRA